jgi:hypothetical protein
MTRDTVHTVDETVTTGDTTSFVGCGSRRRNGAEYAEKGLG